MEHVLSDSKAVILILVMAFVTFLTRVLPFILFDREGSTPPRIISYLGSILPPAVIAMLVVFVLRNVDILGKSHGIPELLACIVTVLLHKWKHNYLISIFVSTAVYMALIRIM